MDLDHVAVATRDVTPLFDTLVGRLGAVVLDGGQALGFRIVQVRAGRPPRPGEPGERGEGMTVELMEPWAVDRFDFLARFLDRNGEGPHHLTFKVEGIEDEIARLEAAGYSPVRTQLVNPWWREAFYHPKQTFGTVIQVAEATFRPELVDAHEARKAGNDDEGGEFGSIEWWPEAPPRPERRAVLRRVVLGVPDVSAATAFFTEVMQGAVDPGGPDTTVVWPGGGRVGLEPRPGGIPGVERFEFDREGEPEELTVAGARLVVGAG